jgi:hypothetical protein
MFGNVLQISFAASVVQREFGCHASSLQFAPVRNGCSLVEDGP